MQSINIEQITIPYNKDMLLSWKERDSKVVPSFMLNWGGPGISNGYGFGEWMAEQYFRVQGYYVFNNDFNLLSKTSKFQRYNKMIETMVTATQLKNFKEALYSIQENGDAIENPDLFVFNLTSCFFVEVKKESDRLREPQMRFFHLAKECLGIDSKLLYLCDNSTSPHREDLIFNFTLNK